MDFMVLGDINSQIERHFDIVPIEETARCSLEGQFHLYLMPRNCSVD